MPGSFEPLSLRVNGRVLQCHNDHLGTPLRLTDETGRLVWSAAYDAFGSARVEGALPQPLRLPGHYCDAELGLHYNRARYYSPELGRYLSPDPLDLLAGLNVYTYANNDPINGSDPLGLLSGWAKTALAATAVVAGAVVCVVAAPIVLPVLVGAVAGHRDHGRGRRRARGRCRAHWRRSRPLPD